MTSVDVRVAEIAARAEAATEGPWDSDALRPFAEIASSDAEFVAHARDDIPWLLSEVRRLRSVVEDAEAEVALARRQALEAQTMLITVVDNRNVACPHWAPGTITMRKGCTACESEAKYRAGADHDQ